MITQQIETRLTLLDALRGCAAMAVVVYHIYGSLAENVQGWIPSIIANLIRLGFLGVPIFFVLSGFVISRSTDRDEVTFTYVGRFILRRSIRLDPPYWCSIAVAVVFMSTKNYLFPQYYYPLPTAMDIAAHIFYLQDILHRDPISVIFWTLCLEIQLYVTYILLRCISDYYSKLTKANPRPLLVGFVLTLGVMSLLVSNKIFDVRVHGLFLPYWHQFLLGVLANWAVNRRGLIDLFPALVFAILVVGIVAVQLLTTLNLNSIGAVIAASLILMASVTNHLHNWLNGAVMQYFGRISYSLYLLHPTIGWSTVSFGKNILGVPLSSVSATLLFFAGIGTSIISAHLLNIFIERPAMALARRIRRSK